MRSCGAGCSRAWVSLRAAALYSVSMVRVDLPPPETPVMQVRVPSGICGRDILEIVAARADHLQPAIVHGLAALARNGDVLDADEIFAGQAFRVGA